MCEMLNTNIFHNYEYFDNWFFNLWWINKKNKYYPKIYFVRKIINLEWHTLKNISVAIASAKGARRKYLAMLIDQ